MDTTNPSAQHDAPANGTASASAATATPAADNVVTLDHPIRQGANEITTLTLRKPKAGELRGVSLADLISMDVAAMQEVVPRIAQPTITKFDVGQMDPADLLQVAGVISGFFMTKAMRASMESRA
ncbi:phage tail assembly protein [Burkholderia gladioli]|uniref:phage tail assembly protein n=1 Tax=Burkholderia gladioli TaxID=28095 RepID=UPI00163EC649|nr:phage tail assembly protein [Burkholderia gladioli]